MTDAVGTNAARGHPNRRRLSRSRVFHSGLFDQLDPAGAVTQSYISPVGFGSSSLRAVTPSGLLARTKKDIAQHPQNGGLPPSTSTSQGVPPIFNLKATDASRWRRTQPVGPACIDGNEVLRTNADDGLPLASSGRVKGGDGLVQGRDGTDVRAQSSVSRPLDDLTQLGAIRFDDELDRKTVSGPCLDRAGNAYQRSSGSN